MKKITRRDALKLGVGSVALAAAGTAALKESQAGESSTPLMDFNSYGEELEKRLILRTSPIAVKMLEKESDIPEGAIRPLKDRGYHLAQCQAFAMSRREGTTVAMLK